MGGGGGGGGSKCCSETFLRFIFFERLIEKSNLYRVLYKAFIFMVYITVVTPLSL